MNTPSAWIMTLFSAFLFPVVFSVWVSSAKRYWVILAERRSAEYVRSNMPVLNVLINNAGIQRRVSLASDTASWPERQAHSSQDLYT
jgi:hypothetical protein